MLFNSRELNGRERERERERERLCCLTSMEARRPIRDGDEWERGKEE